MSSGTMRPSRPSANPVVEPLKQNWRKAPSQVVIIPDKVRSDIRCHHAASIVVERGMLFDEIAETRHGSGVPCQNVQNAAVFQVFALVI